MSDARATDPWSWVESLQRFGVRPGLERVRALLDALDRPQDALSIALIAGTNGKGSTTAMLDAMGRADPGRDAPVGRFVSPHLMRFDERVHVDGAPLPFAAWGAWLDEVRPHAERLGATFFEVLTAVALLAFARRGVRRAVLEVGMGGRWDATNATEPDVSVVTQVALDHERVLGDTVEAIAAEKAGVWRRGRPALTSADGPALRVLRAAARDVGAHLTALDDLNWRPHDLGWDGVRATGLGPTAVDSPLLGAHQARNLGVAVLAARAWGLPWDAVVAGAGAARWPGRLELLEVDGRRWLLDGAHNPAGVAALRSALGVLGARPAVAVVGLTADRLDGPMPAALAALAPTVVATRPPLSPRAADAAALAAALRAGATAPVVHAVDSTSQALELAAVHAPVGATVVVAGSLYLVGAVRPLLTGEVPERFERWQ